MHSFFIRYKKTIIFLAAILIFFVSIAGYLYAFRIREELIQTRESYKVIYESMRADIATLEEELISQGSFVTDKMTGTYDFSVDPKSVQLNHAEINHPSPDSSITIIAGGHLYGNPYNEGDPVIASTLKNDIQTINSSGVDMFFSLGDMTYLPSLESVNNLRDEFLDEIEIPVFNAVGNHDLKNGRTFYEENFSDTYYSFRYGPIQVIVLDTVISHCYIVGHQYDMLEDSIQNVLQDNEIDNVLIFMHKLIFLDEEDLIGRANGECAYGSNFTELRDELLIPASRQKPIYIIAGDVGAFSGNLSPFYYQYPDSNLYTIAAGIGDSDEDALIRIEIQEGEVDFDIIPLGEKQFDDLTSYTPDYWYLQPH